MTPQMDSVREILGLKWRLVLMRHWIRGLGIGMLVTLRGERRGLVIKKERKSKFLRAKMTSFRSLGAALMHLTARLKVTSTPPNSGTWR